MQNRKRSVLITQQGISGKTYGKECFNDENLEVCLEDYGCQCEVRKTELCALLYT